MYYKLCYEYHPDRTGGMHQDKFKEINNAYHVLSDEKKKKQYDEMRDATTSSAGQDFYNQNSAGGKTYNPNSNTGQSKYKQKQQQQSGGWQKYSEYSNSSSSGGYQPPNMDPEKFRREAERTA